MSSGVSRTEEGAFGDNMVPSDAHFRTVISSGFFIKEYAYPVYVVPMSIETTNGFLETLSLKSFAIQLTCCFPILNKNESVFSLESVDSCNNFEQQRLP